MDVPPRDRQPLHRHTEPRAILFLAGQIIEDSVDGRAVFAPGDVLLRPAHLAHADAAGPEGAAYVRLSLPEPLLNDAVARRGWRPARTTVDLRRPWSIDDLLARLRTFCPEPPAAPSAETAAAGQLAGEPAARVHQVAGRVGLKGYELTRRFAARFGVTPVRYRRHARLDRAVRMIASTVGSLADVAQDAGYYDQAQMTRDLVRELGTTPAALRSAARKYKT